MKFLENRKLQALIERLKDIGLYIWQHRWSRILLFCLPIIIYYLPLLLTGNKEAPGDPDYYFALYEGFRKSVVDYHQFPWWDPWISGGVPLFGNIEFGLISITSPLVLLFGSVMGIKLSLMFYSIIGFFGARRLLHRYFKTSEVRSIALAYVFAFCGFFAARASMGHITFPLVAYTPWVVYYFLYIQEKRAWIKFALIYGLFIDTAPHYTAIMTTDILVLLFIIETFRLKISKSNLAFTITQRRERSLALLKAAGLLLVVIGYRMYYVLDFYSDYRRTLNVASEKFTTIQNGFLAMWGYPNYSTAPGRGLTWGWGEIATYIGAGTFFATVLILIAWLHYKKNFAKQFSRSIWVLLALFVIFFALGMGDFSRLAPYALAQKLPLFSDMRVATRWIFWDACTVLLIIGAYKGKKYARTITVLAVLAALELFIRYPTLISRSYFLPTTQYRSATAPFYQEKYNRVPRPGHTHDKAWQKKYWFDQNLYESTKNNIGEPFASDSLLYKTFLGDTFRCQYFPDRTPCPFVVSGNAKVTYWSPNHLTLKRTGPGPIDLDMNPGRGWRINGQYAFIHGKSVDAEAYFKFGYSQNNQRNYDIVYAPKLSPNWFGWKIEQEWHKL